MKTTGEIIKGLREARGLTQQQLADIVEAKSYTTITKWESNDNFPKGKDIIKLCSLFNVTSDYILGLEEATPSATSFYPYFPVSISAGCPIKVCPLTEDDVDTIELPDAIMGKWAGNSEIFITRVNGDSMNNIFPHGSLIAVKKTDIHQLQNGDIVVYSYNGEYSVKHFLNLPDEEIIIFRPDSNNNRFTDNVISYDNASEIKICGKVVLYTVELD